MYEHSFKIVLGLLLLIILIIILVAVAVNANNDDNSGCDSSSDECILDSCPHELPSSLDHDSHDSHHSKDCSKSDLSIGFSDKHGKPKGMGKKHKK